MRKVACRILIFVGGLCVWLPFCSVALDSESNTLSSPAATSSESNAATEDSLRAYLQLQERIHETLLAIERTRQESEDTASRNSNSLAQRLQLIEQSLGAQRASELEVVQHANRTLVIVVSSFAALGCLAVLLTAYLQWRAVNRFTAISSALALRNGGGSWTAMASLPGADGVLPGMGNVEPINLRLLGAIERLEHRIQELERAARPALGVPGPEDNILNLQPAAEPSPAGSTDSERGGERSPAFLIAKGQSLLNATKWEDAIDCFDRALAADPRNAEALVKKGTALEQLRRAQEALDCYDRAIAIDSSMTIAYLYKGGLYNRMERFTEALACYEQALHTQEQRRAG